MGLLDSGPGLATVSLFPDVEVTDTDGNAVRAPSETPLPVTGRWQYDNTGEDMSAGQTTLTTATFRSRSFPSGFAGRVEFDGRGWDVVGEPEVHGLSGATRHVVVKLRARAPRPV